MASKAESVDTRKPLQMNGKSPSDCSSGTLTSTRHSRLVERTEMRKLNDRLVSYIDRVRILENENARLCALVQASTETVDREIANNNQMYKDELSETRKLLDELASEKAKLQIDAKRVWDENDELKQKYDKAVMEARTFEGDARLYESKYNDSVHRYNATVAEHKKATVDAENMKIELINLRERFEEYRKNLEMESVARIDSDCTVRSLREELKFKDQLRNVELNETKTLRLADVAEVSTRMAEQYKANLQESLQELRDQYDDQMRLNRSEVEALFDKKMKNGQATAIQRDNKAFNATFQYLCNRVDTVNARIGELEQINATLNQRVRDVISVLDGERARSAEKESEMNSLREEIALQLERYQDLMDIKVSLDLEIAAYDKLLGCEEHHFKLKSSNSSQSFSNSVRGSPAAKRNRNESFEVTYDFVVTSSVTGQIEITEADPAAKFVKLHNRSKSEASLGGWKLIRQAGANVTVHKFHCMVVVDGGADLVIWSADCDIPASPGNMTLESQNWFVAQEMKTILVNGDGEVQASTERIRQPLLPRSDGTGGRQNNEARDKCIIM